MKQLYEKFLEPGAEYRGKPFWSWNGVLDREEMIRQIHVFKEMGFGGFFMHSRTGLATEYLGEEWFGLINRCAEEAEALGMEAWLYDEDRWPSGTAGGMVTQEPKYRMKFIRLDIIAAKDYVWKDDRIAAFSCRLEGLAFYDCKRLEKQTSSEELNELKDSKDQSILLFTVVEMEKESFYNGFTYVDTLNREATEHFLHLTHDKYKLACGDKFGKSIKGIFTDEPHRGQIMDGFGINNENKEWLAPWTYRLFEKFTELFGYDLTDRLPELFLQKEGGAVSQVKWHYVELLQVMFLDNFAKPMDEWCRKNNLILTGHILHEDNLTAQTAMSGSVMRYYEHMEYPGIDVLTEGNTNYWIAKQLQSAARQLGRKWLLSELYGCTGWQMPLEAHKSVGDWQALFGINLRCHHLSWYTMEGESKRDYPASISHQSAWWQEYSHVETYFSRIGWMLNQGKPSCDILVLNPVESVWCQVYPGWSNTLSPNSTAVKDLEKHYAALFHMLAGAQLDFDYGDEDMLKRLYRIDTNPNGTPVLYVGEARYKAVLVSGMTTMRSTTLQILQQFHRAGGSVIFTGEAPAYMDAVPSAEVANFAKGALQVAFDREEVVEACELVVSIRLQALDGKTGERIGDLFCHIRVDGENQYVFIINVNREKAYTNVKIQLTSNGYVQEWCCVTGAKSSIPIENKHGLLKFRADFPASGEHMYVITAEKNEEIMEKLQVAETIIGTLDGPFDYTLSEPNVCVLDLARFRLNDGAWQDELEILKVDRYVRKEVGLDYRAGNMVQPWFAQKNAYEIKGRLALCFDFEVKDMPKPKVELVLEHPENFTILINGHSLEIKGEEGWWVDTCFKRIHIPAEFFLIGLNTVELQTDFHQGIDLEALYLIGEFGVQLMGTRKILTVLPEQIAIGDLTEQGLPFYSGIVTYKLNLTECARKTVADDPRIQLSLPSFEGACAKVRSINGESTMISWQPYTADITAYVEGNLEEEPVIIELDVILTRRNTFGPLHLASVYSDAYGPEHWITEGEAFSKAYKLVPSGLLKAPCMVELREITIS